MQASIQTVPGRFHHVLLQTWNEPASAILMAPGLNEKIEPHVGWSAKFLMTNDYLYEMNMGIEERLALHDEFALRFVSEIKGLCVVRVANEGLRSGSCLVGARYRGREPRMVGAVCLQHVEIERTIA